MDQYRIEILVHMSKGDTILIFNILKIQKYEPNTYQNETYDKRF